MEWPRPARRSWPGARVRRDARATRAATAAHRGPSRATPGAERRDRARPRHRHRLHRGRRCGTPDGPTLRARDDPPAGAHPGHATRRSARRGLLDGAGSAGASSIASPSVVGPGTFTGPARRHRHRARARAVARRASSSACRACGRSPTAPRGRRRRAAGARGDRRAPRRGVRRRLRRGAEGQGLRAEPRWRPRARRVCSSSPSSARHGSRRWLAVGDGALRYRGELEAAGVAVPPDDAAAPRSARGDLRARRSPRGGGTRACPTTGADRTRSSRCEGAARRRRMSAERSPLRATPRASRRRDQAARLPRPAAGDRDRAARVPDAVVACDVRARALQAVGDLPRGGLRRAAPRLPDLLPLRHRVARDEHRGRPRASAPGSGIGAARGALRRVGDEAARFTLEVRRSNESRSTCTSAKAFARRACGGATTRTTARTRW